MSYLKALVPEQQETNHPRSAAKFLSMTRILLHIAVKPKVRVHLKTVISKSNISFWVSSHFCQSDCSLLIY